MKPEDRKRLKQHIEMIVEHKIPSNVVFCPNCEKDVECIHTAELYECKECGEDFAKYIVSRKPAESDVSVTQDVLMDIKTPNSDENICGEIHEFHFTEALRNVAKQRPADVSAIGVSILIDYVEELEQENKSIRHILSLWKKTEAMKEIEKLNTILKSKDIVIASQEGRINKLALDLLQIKGISE